MSFFNLPFVYKILRPGVLMGLNTPAVMAFMKPAPGDKILDVGCGYGMISSYFGHCDYTGIDLDAERIAWAKKNIGETPSRRFLLEDLLKVDYPDGHFDKAIGYGVMHHLSDDQARGIMKILGRIVKGGIYFSDPVYSRYHFFSNLLCRLDVGDHVRWPEEYHRLYSEVLDVTRWKFYHSNNGLAKYYLAECRGKR